MRHELGLVPSRAETKAGGLASSGLGLAAEQRADETDQRALRLVRDLHRARGVDLRLRVVARLGIGRLTARIAVLAAPAIALVGTRVTAAAATAPTLAFRPAAAIAAAIAAIGTLLRLRDRRRGNRLALLGKARVRFADLVFVSGGLIGPAAAADDDAAAVADGAAGLAGPLARLFLTGLPVPRSLSLLLLRQIFSPPGALPSSPPATPLPSSSSSLNPPITALSSRPSLTTATPSPPARPVRPMRCT